MNAGLNICYNRKMHKNKDDNMASTLEKLYDCLITGFLDILSEKAQRIIEQLGLSDDEKDVLKKYSFKIFWCSVLEQYLKNKINLNFKEKAFLYRTIFETKDMDLAAKLNKFLRNTNKDEAKKLGQDIYEGIPKDALEDFCKIVKKFSK